MEAVLADLSSTTTGVSQAARTLGISRQYVVYLADRGRLASMRTPLGRLTDVRSIERFAAERAGELVPAA